MSHKIRIGFDFDNTIICYDELFYQAILEKKWNKNSSFPSHKSAIKQALIDEDGNDFRWQEIQAIVYGQLIKNAKPFPGFTKALEILSKIDGVEIFVVSHKTKYSHYLKHVELIDSAKAWCEDQRLFHFIKKENWFFLPTRDEKIQKIKDIKIDVFVDDLNEVFEDGAFPAITKFLFNPQDTKGYSDWNKILESLNLLVVLGPEGFLGLNEKVKFPILSYEMIKRDGNNKIIKITDSENNKLIIKKYSSLSTNYSTLETEFKAISYLSQNHFPVPRPYLKNEKSSFALYEQIEPPLSMPTDQEIIRDFSSFMAKLVVVSKNSEAQQFPVARDSRETIGDYYRHIERRLKTIQDACTQNPDLKSVDDYLKKAFHPLLEKVLENYRHFLKRFSLDETKPLGQSEKFLSPSDFGIHNALFNKKNDQFCFIDFEYFGWDDMAKLVADFIHHAGQNINLATRLEVLKEFSTKAVLSDEFFMRLSTIIDLVGLEWILIILNIADPQVLQRRIYANPDLNLKDLINQRVEKAYQRADLCRSNISSDSVFITINSNDKKMVEIQQWHRLITLI